MSKGQSVLCAHKQTDVGQLGTGTLAMGLAPSGAKVTAPTPLCSR